MNTDFVIAGFIISLLTYIVLEGLKHGSRAIMRRKAATIPFFAFILGVLILWKYGALRLYFTRLEWPVWIVDYMRLAAIGMLTVSLLYFAFKIRGKVRQKSKGLPATAAIVLLFTFTITTTAVMAGAVPVAHAQGGEARLFGKIADDGTLIGIVYRTLTAGYYPLEDWDLVKSDDLVMYVYAPNRLGQVISIEVRQFMPIYNETTGELVGARNERVKTVRVSVPHEYQLQTVHVKLLPSKEKEMVVISYRNINFTFWHRTSRAYTILTLSWLQNWIETAGYIAGGFVVAALATLTAKRSIKHFIYMPKIPWFNVLCILGAIGLFLYGLSEVVLETILSLNVAITYVPLFALFFLFALQHFSYPLADLLIEHYPPRQNPDVPILRKGYATYKVAQVDGQLVHVEEDSWRDFIARAFGAKSYITLEPPEYALEIRDVFGNFAYVFCIRDYEVRNTSFDKGEIAKRLAVIGAAAGIIILALSQPVAWIGLPLLIVGLLGAHRKWGLFDPVIQPGHIRLYLASPHLVENVNDYLWGYITTVDIARELEELETELAATRATLELRTGQKARAIVEEFDRVLFPARTHGQERGESRENPTHLCGTLPEAAGLSSEIGPGRAGGEQVGCCKAVCERCCAEGWHRSAS